MAAHEATRDLSRENERLRLGIAGAREGAARAEEEASRLRYAACCRMHAFGSRQWKGVGLELCKT